MIQEKREKREQQIEQAAYELFEEKGYVGTSMLSVAKRAKASNETLYRWYGDKQGLVLSLIERNLKDVREALEEATQATNTHGKELQEFGTRLLQLLVSQRSITLNRAAAADTSGELGKALAKGGRETVVPLLETVFQRLIAENSATGISKGEAAALYINLLVGDIQIRRVIGVLDSLSKAEIKGLSDRAYRAILKLLA